jgi:hypothetical protein
MTGRPRYLDALLRHLRAVGIEPGKVHHVEVRHDDGCAHWKGRPCDCEPEIETGARVDRDRER